MIRYTRTFVALTSLMLSATAFAVTGSSSLIAGSSGSNYGYTTGVGAMSNPTLSDGKVIATLLTSQPGNMMVLQVKGFTSDPGKSYFGTLRISNCVGTFTPTNLSSGSATYGYSAGVAIWGWSRPTACFQAPTINYNISIF